MAIAIPARPRALNFICVSSSCGHHYKVVRRRICAGHDFDVHSYSIPLSRKKEASRGTNSSFWAFSWLFKRLPRLRREVRRPGRRRAWRRFLAASPPPESRAESRPQPTPKREEHLAAWAATGAKCRVRQRPVGSRSRHKGAAVTSWLILITRVPAQALARSAQQ